MPSTRSRPTSWWALTVPAATAVSRFPRRNRKWYFHEYPFAWFGILAEAPRSSDELIYANSDNGFALISQRTETVQRMYFQCDPKENVADWDDDRIWAEFRSRVNGNGFELKEGPVIEKMVLPFRSFVHTPMRHGNLFLAGDAAHTVPPTGAKGLNLAIHDVKVLFEGLDSHYNSGSDRLLDAYSDRALERVWKAQQFSYWMTTMLHTPADADDFSRARQLGELQLRGRLPGTAWPTSPRRTPAGRAAAKSATGPAGAGWRRPRRPRPAARPA